MSMDVGIKTNMAIFYYAYKTPMNVSDESQINLKDIALFANKQEIPADFRKDITPSGYRDQYVLNTKTNLSRKDHREDTVGTIEVTLNGKKVSAYSTGMEGGSANLIETETKKSFFDVNESTPTFILARPNALDGGKGIRVDGVVCYVSSDKS